MTPEFQRLVRAVPAPPEELAIEATATERAALATRFGVSAIESLRAEMEFDEVADGIEAHGKLAAEVVQPCAVSGEDFTTRIEEPLALRFVRQVSAVDPDSEAEFPIGSPDEIEFSGESFDLGEAVAQSLGLAIDPYAEGPGADEARRAAGIVPEGQSEGPLADLLRGLKPS